MLTRSGTDCRVNRYTQEPFTQTMATTWPGSDDVSENTRS